jgi:glycosyltransferase involved in cell wall biosynthesis
VHVIKKANSIDDCSPLVTVAIPVFRGEKYIKRAIESVLKQSYSNYELVIVDNKSDDNTENVVNLFEDIRIKYFRNNINVGAQENWNICLKRARGKYIKILPHDDFLDENCLMRQVSVMEQDSVGELSFVFSSRKIVAENEETIANRGIPFVASGVIESERLIKKCILSGTNLIGEPGAVLFRADHSKKIGWFDGSIPYVIDLDYWYRLLLVGKGFYIKEPLCSFRITADSWSNKIGSSQTKQYLQFIKKIKHVKLKKYIWILCMIRAHINGYARFMFYKIWS